jgi:hypothetical protein
LNSTEKVGTSKATSSTTTLGFCLEVTKAGTFGELFANGRRELADVLPCEDVGGVRVRVGPPIAGLDARRDNWMVAGVSRDGANGAGDADLGEMV